MHTMGEQLASKNSLWCTSSSSSSYLLHILSAVTKRDGPARLQQDASNHLISKAALIRTSFTASTVHILEW